MKKLLRNAAVFWDGKMQDLDVLISDSGMAVFGRSPSTPASSMESFAAFAKASAGAEMVDCQGCVILPGFADVHVHFREPGFSYKGTVLTESRAAARGGFTCALTMPNLEPAPSDLDGVRAQLDIIERDAVINVIPFGTITKLRDGRSALSDMEAIAPYVCGYSDDGCGVQTAELMRDAMEVCASLGKIISAHCEDESLVGGTACHDGPYARSIGIQGISSASEWRQIERDVKLADETGCAYHVCHISTREGVEIIRDAQRSGVNVTCETGPHYLTLTDQALARFDKNDPRIGRFKMYPPLREEADRQELIRGLKDGTVSMIATDHAPHSAEEKSRGLLNSANGVVGLETAFAVLYTTLVKPGILPLPVLVDRMALLPRERFDLPGAEAWDIITSRSPRAPLPQDPALPWYPASDLTVIDVSKPYRIDPAEFVGKGHSTPFEDMEVYGRTRMTFLAGKCVYDGR